MRYCQFIVLGLILASVSHAQDEAIIEAFKHRLDHYHGLEFEYTVTFDIETTLDAEPNEIPPEDAIHFLRIAKPIDEGSLQYRILWKRTVPNPGEPVLKGVRVVDRWIGFDGRETRRFDQTFLTQPNPKKESLAIIRPRNEHGWYPGSQDCFFWFISADFFNLPSYARPYDPDIALNWFNTKPKGAETIAGVQATAYEFSPTDQAPVNLSRTTWVTATPTPMVLRTEVGEFDQLGDEGGKSLVTKVDEYDGVQFPAAGRSVSAMGSIMHIASFQVRSVRRRSESELNNWFPEWPPGTNVKDESAGRMIRIPYEPEQQDAIRRHLMVAQVSSPRNWGRVALIIFNVVAVGFLLYFVYRKFRYGSQA